MIAAIGSAKTVEEERQLIQEADRYLIEKHLYLWGPIMPQVAVTQPWIVGYSRRVFGDAPGYGRRLRRADDRRHRSWRLPTSGLE